MKLFEAANVLSGWAIFEGCKDFELVILTEKGEQKVGSIYKDLTNQIVGVVPRDLPYKRPAPN